MTFDDDDMTATITNNFQYEANDLVIPENVVHNGKIYTVTKIGNGAFNLFNMLTGSLTIPDSVTSIGSYAFAECAALTGSLTIGSGVTSIGSYAFAGCEGFTNITLDGYSSTPSWNVDTNIFYE
jgi:hypothetical protein